MKKIIITLALAASMASCSKMDLFAEKACYEFYNHQGDIVHEECNMSEADAKSYYKKHNLWGYKKK